MPYVAYSKTLFISELIELNVVCLSSFTGASRVGNDGASVFSVAYSKHLVHNTLANLGLKDLHFLPYLAYSKTLFISELIELNVVCLSSFTGAPNLRNDGASVFSVAYSKHLVHKIWD